MVNCYNSFDRLNEIIVGNIDESIIEFIDQNQRQRLEYIINITKEELDQFQQTLESRNIKVHRPVFHKNMKISTPNWSSHGLKIPFTPRDDFLILGNTIVETASWQKERFFQSFHYRDIFIDYFNRGANWISMPMPRHDRIDPDPLDSNNIPNRDPMFDAANIIKFGKDIFISGGGADNQLGYNWICRHFGNDYRLHRFDQEKFAGHLDTHFAIIRPGLLLTYYPKDFLPEYFHNWDIIYLDPAADREISNQQILYDEKIQDDDFVNTVVSTNILSIDQNTIMLLDHLKNNKYLLNQLERFGVEPLFVKFTYSHFFNQGLTCITLDTVRDTNGCIDYKNL